MSLLHSLVLGALGLPAFVSTSEGPEPVANFSLTDASGHDFVLYDEAVRYRGTVLAWTGVECPIAKLYAPRLAQFHRDYSGEGIRFLGVDPNIQDSAEEVRQRCEEVGIEFPILMDPMQAVTDLFGVTRTTEVILLDQDLRILYRGAVDDQYSVGAQKPHPTNQYLQDALEALLLARDCEVTRTDAEGCLIGRTTGSSPPDLTYHRDIAPILQQQCIECHRPGQIGPMALQSYDDARGWAPMIAEVVSNGRMPPWHADPRYGDFRNRRLLTETQKAMLVAWALGGAAEGDPADAPEPRTFEDPEWVIGPPDLVVELPAEQSIPAQGVVPYRYVEVDPGLTEDRWVQAAEIRPTNTAATHHVLILLIPPGKTIDEVLGTGDARAFLDIGYFAVQVPGNRPNVYPEGMGKFLPAGSKFLFQLHYTPTGTAGVDRSRMALRWCAEPPTRAVLTRGIGNADLDIPPGQKDVSFTARHRFKDPVDLLSIFPHMHTRGAAFEVEHIGLEDQVILDVPRYDFNWQNFYRFREPYHLDAADSLFCTATYDNSPENPYNPDPAARVRWGDQTFEEMMIAYVDYVECDE